MNNKERTQEETEEQMQKAAFEAEGAHPTPEDESTSDTADTLEQRVKELEDQLLRSAAEFENYKKRTARLYDDMAKAANDRLLGDLLDVIDNFDRALHHAQANTDPSAIVKGTELIFSQLQGVLTKEGITAVDSLGKPFDPKLHDAIMEVETDAYPMGTVALELSKAYVQGERVLRHAKVGVSKGKQ
jgi:molecular chaperone GrpE